MLDKYDEEMLEHRLKQMKDTNVALVCDGEAEEPERIMKRCVCEESSYMADYVFDSDGALTELRYDKVSNK